jgi:hypothetical protein
MEAQSFPALPTPHIRSKKPCATKIPLDCLLIEPKWLIDRPKPFFKCIKRTIFLPLLSSDLTLLRSDKVKSESDLIRKTSDLGLSGSDLIKKISDLIKSEPDLIKKTSDLGLSESDKG